jgi:Fur family zinc uptake transcriptional regulator
MSELAESASSVSPILPLLERAAEICAGRGARLTSLRRDVLELILESRAPVGAYDLLDRLRARRGGGAPPTVYRALEFLQEQGLVHRLERLSAFVGCAETLGGPPCHGHDHHTATQFLICRRCGRVIEIEDRALAEALAAAALREGFALASATVEAEGECAACRVGAAGVAPPGATSEVSR